MDHHHDDINIVMSMAKLSGWKFSFSENGDDDDDDDDDDDGDDDDVGGDDDDGDDDEEDCHLPCPNWLLKMHWVVAGFSP